MCALVCESTASHRLTLPILSHTHNRPYTGMTGTAATEVSEFDSIYKLPVAVVPTNRPISREDNPDVVFRLEQYKWKVCMHNSSHTRAHARGSLTLYKKCFCSFSFSVLRFSFSVLSIPDAQ